VGKYGRVRHAAGENVIDACALEFWISRATKTRSKYVKLIDFLRQQWLRKRASALHYTNIACIV